jgi:hypothetical protein
MTAIRSQTCAASPTYDPAVPMDAAFEAQMARHYIPDTEHSST